MPAHAQLRFGDIENNEVKEYIAQNDLCEIAEGLATAGDFEFALTTFKNALETVQQIDDPEKRSVAEITVLRRTAAVMIKAGNTYSQPNVLLNATCNPVHQSNGKQIIRNAYAWTTDRKVPERSFAVSKYQRGRGAVRSRRITPISRS